MHAWRMLFQRASKGTMEAEERDCFKEVPLRYLGYANEVGEAFRHMVPVRLVHFSYFVASTYVITHSVSRSTIAKSQSLNNTPLKTRLANSCDDGRLLHSSPSPAKAFLDTLIWQGLASVVIPGLVINRTCALSRILLSQVFRKRLSMSVRKWTVTGVGLAAIPIIIHPIDRTVDKVMDIYMRPVLFRPL